MRTTHRSFTQLAMPAAALALLLTGCNGGGSADGSLSIRCGDGAAFCVASCDLGCGDSGCAVTEVAENQRLRFIFSQRIDPASVNGSSFAIRTTAGEAPFGETLVQDNTITFVPRIRVTNGVSSFGFQRNQTYVLTMAGGPTASQSIRSISGDRLSREMTCTITATLGIIDEDGSPPSATLIAPPNPNSIPLDATFVLRFSEVIDSSAFTGTVTSGSPIQFLLHRMRNDPLTQEPICESNSQPILLEGIPRVSLEQFNGKAVTVISFKPNVTLPGQSCVLVRVTSDIRDLAGVAGRPAEFITFTEAGQVQDIRIEETFASATRMDTRISGGVWQNGARPALLGGDGRHGSFDPTIGNLVSANVYEWDTDTMTIPGSRTLNGQAATVTDGKFYFTDMTLPQGTTVRFKGSNPVQIFVRGKTEIRGRIELNARAQTTFRARVANSAAVIQGQAGTLGGPGGGRGGQGGATSNGLGTTTIGGVIQEYGRPGEDVHLPAGHAYLAQSANTGGQGSVANPSNGLNTSITPYELFNVYSGKVSAGGGGGGFSAAGQASSVPPQTSITAGAPAPGGVAFPLIPYPTNPPANYSSLVHFLVGGSGGGGGGTHVVFSQNTSVDKWRAGGGGTGGGGAFALRSGNDLLVDGTGFLQSRGGNGAIIDGDDPGTPTFDNPVSTTSWGVAAPGGAGSGGSFLLQSAAALTAQGTIDTAGGTGSRTGGQLAAPFLVTTLGGNGSPGFYRIEAAGTATVAGAANTPVFNAAEHQGPLNDRDDLAGAASLWRGTGTIFPPTWLRYELEVDVDGNGTVDNIYSDDPAVPNSIGVATDPLGPVRVQFQGARVNSTTNLPDPGTEGPWRDFVNVNAGGSINTDSPTGFRFQLIFNRRDFPNAVVRRLLVVARG